MTIFHRYDPFRSAWMLSCVEDNSPQEVSLTEFRRLNPFSGTVEPPVSQIFWHCDSCDKEHQHFLTSRDLDWAPFCEVMPPMPDLIYGVDHWEINDLTQRWLSKTIHEGKWPFALPCATCNVLIPSWPSQLRQIFPHNSDYLVSHLCPRCEFLQQVQVPASALTLALF